MNLRFEDEVAEDLNPIEDKLEDRILKEIFDLEDDPLPENSYVIRLPDSTEVQCPKLQEQDRNSELNHRVTYDIEGKQVRIYRVFPREPGYREIKHKTQERL